MRKRRNCKFWGILIFTGVMAGMALAAPAGKGGVDDRGEQALADRTWQPVKTVIERKLGTGYHEIGMCTGFLYWCLDNAYGVDWGENSRVSELEDRLMDAGITKVAEGRTGIVTREMKPGDIIIFADGGARSHCAILGEAGRIYHADCSMGVRFGPTLAEWMELPHEDRNCDRYIIYRGLGPEEKI